MLAAALFAFVLAAPAQAAPPPMIEGPTTEAPADPAAPPTPEAAPPSTPPPSTTPAPAVPPPDPAQRPPGMDPLMVAALMSCVGCVTGVVVGPILAAIPVIGALLGPGLIGVVEVFLGDMLGQQRGAMLWPVIGAYAAWAVGAPVFIGGGVLVGVLIGGAAIGGLIATVGQNPNPLVILPVLLGAYLGVLVPIVVGVLLWQAGIAVTPAVVYMLTAEDKKPGDTGSGFPGLLEPGHPPTSVQVHRRRVVGAMAF